MLIFFPFDILVELQLDSHVSGSPLCREVLLFTDLHEFGGQPVGLHTHRALGRLQGIYREAEPNNDFSEDSRRAKVLNTGCLSQLQKQDPTALTAV